MTIVPSHQDAAATPIRTTYDLSKSCGIFEGIINIKLNKYVELLLLLLGVHQHY